MGRVTPDPPTDSPENPHFKPVDLKPHLSSFNTTEITSVPTELLQLSEGDVVDASPFGDVFVLTV